VRAAWGLAMLVALLLSARHVGAASGDDIAAAASPSALTQVSEPTAAAEGVAAAGASVARHTVVRSTTLYMYLCAVVNGKSCSSSKAALEVGLARDVGALATRSGIRLTRNPSVSASRLLSRVSSATTTQSVMLTHIAKQAQSGPDGELVHANTQQAEHIAVWTHRPTNPHTI
jgi:hypothetical protein